MEPLFLLLLRQFHVPAQKYRRISNLWPERWNVVTMLCFETASAIKFFRLRPTYFLLRGRSDFQWMPEQDENYAFTPVAYGAASRPAYNPC